MGIDLPSEQLPFRPADRRNSVMLQNDSHGIITVPPRGFSSIYVSRSRIVRCRTVTALRGRGFGRQSGPWTRATPLPSSDPNGDVMALELRPNCECCDRDLPPSSTVARICSFECTFCADCVENVLHNVCPNCGGGLVPRPVRPVNEWRPGVSLTTRPSSSLRVHLSYGLDDIGAFTERVRDIPPENR
jgi:uncharacterized protein